VTTWRKSSYSGPNNACVEVWRKSSYSGPNNECVEVWSKSSHSGANNDCVEVVRSLDRVRDSKNPAGPVLTVDLRRFVADLKADRFTS
jgi:hypothetical protein